MSNDFFKKVILICGGISLLCTLVLGYSFFVISQQEVTKPKKIFSIGNYWFGLKKREKIEWQASNYSQIGKGLTYFFASVDSVDPETQTLAVFTAEGKKLKVRLTTEAVSTFLFQIPAGENYLSLHRLYEKPSSIKKNELIFIFGRKYGLKLTEEEIKEGIDFLASEIVRKR